MPVSDDLNCVPRASRRLGRTHIASLQCLLLFCVGLFSVLPLAAKTKTTAALDPGYVPALAAADHLLQAWQSGDPESGLVLLTTHAKQAATTEVVERFFSDPGPVAYEIAHGKLLKPGRYEFPVVLVLDGKNAHPRRRFTSIIVVNTGNNDWAIDKLP